MLYSKSDWLRRNPDTARRLARAIQQSLLWIAEHSPEEILAKLPSAYVGDDRAVYLDALKNAMAMYSKNGIMPTGAPEVVRKVVSASLDNVRSAHIDIAATYTNEFVSNR